MYLDHFGLRESPFRITPHPDFFFGGADRAATLEALIYAILHEEGMVKVSGEIGSGKTMLCRMLLEQLPAHVETVFLANPSYSREDILYAIADELKLAINPQRASPALRELQDHLIGVHGAGRRVVILIDEAHAMPRDTLEEVRLLSNLETTRHKLLQIVLFGQPELDEALAQPALRQLKDRITHNFRTRAFTHAEVGEYLAFRMRAAGHRGASVFTPAAATMLARGSSGLTRRINVLADKSLLAAFTEHVHAVEPRHVQAAQADAELTVPKCAIRVARWLAAGAAICGGGILIGATGHRWLDGRGFERVPAPDATAARSPTAPPAPQAPGSAPVQGTARPTQSVQQGPARDPLLSDAQVKRIASFAVESRTLLGERIAATQERLQREPDRSYCVELFITENSDPARLERFLVRARALLPLADLYVIPIASGSRYRIRVVYGAYPDRDAAAAAAQRLPPKYQSAFRTGLRSFAALRAAV